MTRLLRKWRVSFRESIKNVGILPFCACCVCALLPSLFFTILILGRVIYFPHSLASPPLPWWLFLPLWMLFSVLPAVTAAVLYGSLCHRKKRLFSSFLWVLLSLWSYHAWMLLCLIGAGSVLLFICTFFCAICALWVIPHAFSASLCAGVSSFVFALWCSVLFMLSIATLF